LKYFQPLTKKYVKNGSKMQGWKYFSLFGLLFLNQLNNVLAASLTLCSSITGLDTTSCSGSTASNYCYNNADKKIYGVDSSDGTKCVTPNINTVQVFKIIDGTATSLTLGTSTIESTEKSSLAIYMCNSNKECNQTVGYAKIETYTETKSVPDDWSTSWGNYYTKTVNNATPTYTKVSQSTAWEADTYYSKNDSAFYEIKKGSSTDASSNDCSASNIGKFSNVLKLRIS